MKSARNIGQRKGERGEETGFQKKYYRKTTWIPYKLEINPNMTENKFGNQTVEIRNTEEDPMNFHHL